MKTDFLRSFLTNVWSLESVDLFLLFMNPVELTSKQFTLQLKPVMSVTKGAYFFAFSRFLFSMFIVRGTVNSKICKFFFSLSTITMSGLRFVTHRF